MRVPSALAEDNTIYLLWNEDQHLVGVFWTEQRALAEAMEHNDATTAEIRQTEDGLDVEVNGARYFIETKLVKS